MEKVSLHQQKIFISENVTMLNENLKKLVLSIIIMGVGGTKVQLDNGVVKDIILDSKSANVVIINLDIVGEYSEDLINQVYNVIKTRRKELSEPLTK